MRKLLDACIPIVGELTNYQSKIVLSSMVKTGVIHEKLFDLLLSSETLQIGPNPSLTVPSDVHVGNKTSIIDLNMTYLKDLLGMFKRRGISFKNVQRMLSTSDDVFLTDMSQDDNISKIQALYDSCDYSSRHSTSTRSRNKVGDSDLEFKQITANKIKDHDISLRGNPISKDNLKSSLSKCKSLSSILDVFESNVRLFDHDLLCVVFRSI